MDILKTISDNLRIIENLDAGTAPTLFRLKEKTNIFEHLRGFLLHMLSYSYPVWPEQQPRFYLFSKQYLQEWCKKNGIPGSIVSWQSHLIFLADCQLIMFFRPTGPSADPVLNRLWQTSCVRHAPYRHAETLWTVQPYTGEKLAYAEEVASQYLQNKANLTHLTKEDVIRIRGQAAANRLYLDGRTRSTENLFAHEQAVRSIRSQVEARGYALLEDVWAFFQYKLLQEKALRYDFPPERYGEYLSYVRAYNKIMLSKQSLAAECGCTYRQSTKKERLLLGLPADYSNWLILPYTLELQDFYTSYLYVRRLPRKASADVYVPRR